MDYALSVVPLAFGSMCLDDAGACSSLDFALRVFSNRVDMNEWHLRQMKTSVGAEGRTYSEGLLWDRERRCVASMTQQCILRVKPGGIVRTEKLY